MPKKKKIVTVRHRRRRPLFIKIIAFIYQDHCYSLPPKEEAPDAKGSSASPSPIRADHLYNKVKTEKPTKIPSKLKNAEPLQKRQLKVNDF
jgi:hypothetical protein